MQKSSLNKPLENKSLSLPPPENVEGISSKISYHIVADDAFPLTENIMKPFPHRNLNKSQRIFNYRLSQARHVEENAFGILANRFRAFLTTIKLNPDKVVDLVLAACCLHNYMVENNKHAYTSVIDVEDTDQLQLISGTWRNDPQLSGLAPTTGRNPW